MHRREIQILVASLTLAAGLASSGCSSGGGGGGGFALVQVTVTQDQIWQINRPIELTFSQAVDPLSVSQTTVQVREVSGGPVAGTFFVRAAAPRTVVFQPRCPTLPDLSDAGFLLSDQAQGIVRTYQLIVSANGGGTGSTVRSTTGSGLDSGLELTFTTPDAADPPAVVFYDTKVGPPAPLIRGVGGVGETELEATYVELGGNADPASRLYFKEGELEGGALLPLNLYSLRESQVALMLLINQPVSPDENNISEGSVRWEYRSETGAWEPLMTSVELVQNCTATGATLRLEPEGLLPAEAELRVVITSTFMDLVGDANVVPLTDFATADSALAPVPPSMVEDELLEPFLVGGAAQDSKHDYLAPLGAPPALWGDDGTLRASFQFGGTGGPGGNFDFQIADGEIFTFDTTSQTITGGPNFIPTTQVTAVGGVLDVRRFRVGEGARLKFSGPNPVTILASGTVEILGVVLVEGNDSVGVATLNTTNIPEPGAPGQAGGGKGGVGSPLTNASSPSGGNGYGAYNTPDGGGRGGETGWNDTVGTTTARRGGGGGGGQMGPDQLVDYGGTIGFDVDESFIGLNLEDGFHGGNNAFGAKNPTAKIQPPDGGLAGPSPFLDKFDDNNFWGTWHDPVTLEIIVGELTAPQPGAGGGGGGDASYTNGQIFPRTPFVSTGDEKGAGAGGAGGVLTMLAIGDIVFGPEGRISARGGTGGGGENTGGLDRVGSGSGGGSAGHVILQTASTIDLSESLAGTGKPVVKPALFATGGQGGVGANNQGGATIGAQGSKETKPELDACHNPALGCKGTVVGAGGDGGPGIIQLHTPTGEAGIITPTGKTLEDICKPTPLGTGEADMLPIFGRTSTARSVWIPLGEGGHDVNDPADPRNLVQFLFAGTNPTTGMVTAVAGQIPNLSEIHPVTPLGSAPSLPHIDPTDPFALVVDAAVVVQGVPQQPLDLQTNPNLLKSFVVDLRQQGLPSDLRRYEIASAVFETDKVPGFETFTLTMDTDGGPLTAFAPPAGVEVVMYPLFFRASTDGQLDELPDSASIEISFEATTADVNGEPDPNEVVSTYDVSVLNGDPGNRDFRFFRFVVMFDIDAQGVGTLEPDQPLPALELFRMPFQFVDASPSPLRGPGGDQPEKPSGGLRTLSVPTRY